MTIIIKDPKSDPMPELQFIRSAIESIDQIITDTDNTIAEIERVI